MTATRSTDQVLSEIEAGRDELLAAVSEAVRIASVNPKYPGQVYDEVVGGEGEVSQARGRGLRGARGRGRLWAIEPGRENAVGVVPGTGGGRSLIYNGHVDVVPPGDRPRSGRAATRSQGISTATASGAAARPT